uniref:Uncharacterized protein n=1 Tax=Sphaerodactylus townsendi TaxID=933632 RepID=A0ACB8EJI4_9SAUR
MLRDTLCSAAHHTRGASNLTACLRPQSPPAAWVPRRASEGPLLPCSRTRARRGRPGRGRQPGGSDPPSSAASRLWLWAERTRAAAALRPGAPKRLKRRGPATCSREGAAPAVQHRSLGLCPPLGILVARLGMGQAGCGRCAVFLVLALVLDAAGLALVLAGAVGKPTLDGSSFEDFLVLSGGLLLFLSLLCWLFWYSGNLRGVQAEELPLGARPSPAAPRARGSLVRLAAKLSERLSQRRRPATAPALPPDPGLGAPSLSSSSPVQLSHLRPAAHPEQGMPEERLHQLHASP